MMVPLVITPREVYIVPLGFFFTPIISRLKVHLSSGCVTWALVNRKPLGRIKRSYFGGFLVKPCPTNVTLVIILFHCLAANNININTCFYVYIIATKKEFVWACGILTFPFTSSDYFKHLIFSHWSNLNHEHQSKFS
ncbi:hypothetical protein Hanom_Chr17g01524971 [Helianthus anomalus]